MAQLLLRQSLNFKKTRWLFVKYLTRRKITNISTYAKHEILNALNSSELGNLTQFGLSPYMIQKLIMEREIVGEFKSIPDLNSIGLSKEKLSVLHKIIMKEEQSIEELQCIIGSYSVKHSYGENAETKIYRESSVDDNYSNRNKATSTKKKKKSPDTTIPHLTTPSFEKYDHQKFNQITAVSLSVPHIALTTLDMNRTIQDMSSIPLVTDINANAKGFRVVELHELYEKVLKVVRQFPGSNLFIFEKGSSISNSPEGLLFSLVKGMLLPLLDKRKDQDDFHPVIFLKNAVVTKLYDLRVGTERKSCIPMGESILASKCNLPWMPPISFNPAALQKYILSTNYERIHMTESLLLAIAFDSVFLKNDYNTVSIL